MPPHPQQDFLGPDQKVSVPQAAEFIGASERALRRTIQMLREGDEPSRASNEWQLPVARAFVTHEKLHLDLTVRGIYEAIGLLSPSHPVRVGQIADAPHKPKTLRNRLDCRRRLNFDPPGVRIKTWTVFTPLARGSPGIRWD